MILKTIVYQGDIADVFAQVITPAIRLSASFFAKISVRSPRKLFVFVIYIYFGVKVSKKYFIQF